MFGFPNIPRDGFFKEVVRKYYDKSEQVNSHFLKTYKDWA
jgi:hypothetical protein